MAKGKKKTVTNPIITGTAGEMTPEEQQIMLEGFKNPEVGVTVVNSLEGLTKEEAEEKLGIRFVSVEDLALLEAERIARHEEYENQLAEIIMQEVVKFRKTNGVMAATYEDFKLISANVAKTVVVNLLNQPNPTLK